MILYRLSYHLFIGIYVFLLRLASLWNPKAKLWVNGRKKIFTRLRRDLENESSQIIWMHCASLGEYEQGRPLLEKLRSSYPGYKIFLTFFSPSGYSVVKDSPIADYIYYLPFGNRLVASRFINHVNPVLVLWIKYDYWFYYLHELSKKNIPLLLISGNFQKWQIFFKWYGKMHRQMLHCFTHLFVQSKYSKSLLNKIGFSDKTTVSGDTRFDRVIEIAGRFEPIEIIEKFCGNDKVIVAGSTWPEDEEELDHFANINPDIKFIIAPHEIDEDHLKYIEKLFKRSIRYSALQMKMADHRQLFAINTKSDQATTVNVLIIDNIGMLSKLYKYATITYVGGGFGESGVHNVLEAAVYGKPVVFGPVFNKYIEAIELLEEGVAYTIETALELEKVFTELLSDHQVYSEVCEAAKRYVYSKKGATDKIIQYIQEKRLLTS
ncbi:MAG: 3-deoxy-D-manno-octulosonic acid transferase [Chitinophagaceae bacterium]|nr:3-deoxy-D-manno-octulosonic acid transferase [Chitinophagaceae bacterium]